MIGTTINLPSSSILQYYQIPLARKTNKRRRFAEEGKAFLQGLLEILLVADEA